MNLFTYLLMKCQEIDLICLYIIKIFKPLIYSMHFDYKLSLLYHSTCFLTYCIYCCTYTCIMIVTSLKTPSFSCLYIRCF